MAQQSDRGAVVMSGSGERIARSFNDIGRIISSCGKSSAFEPESDVPVIWFRGQRMADWSIIPSMYRRSLPEHNDGLTYSSYHLMEDYRYHSFRAKAGHHVGTGPGFKLEWQEIMQHHLVTTRLLDWTESAVTALIFALEPLLQPKNDLTTREKRHNMAPVLWLLKPYELNLRIYGLVTTPDRRGRYPFIERAMEHLLPPRKLASAAAQIGGELQAHRDIYFDSQTDISINGLINLSAVEAVCRQRAATLLEALTSFEINPFHYVLLRLYADGLVIDIGDREAENPLSILPPLATVHQYHSTRIQAQRGVFLVVPHYRLSGGAKSMYNSGIDLRAMELQSLCAQCLVKIRIVNPSRIAKELLYSGERLSAIYPELPTYAEDIEAGEYYI